MDHGRVDQVGTPQDIFANPISQFVARFTGDNNIFTGQVENAVKDGQGYLIQLTVEALGTLWCRGEYAQVGADAACCVRADRLHIKPLTPAVDSGTEPAHNQVSARITAVEFTGYITRVSLALEKTGVEVLYKARTTDWVAQPICEGQVVQLDWSAQDCVFLAH